MSSISRGLFLMALGIALMSVMDAIIKHLSGTMSAPQVMFFRAFFGLIPILLMAFWQGKGHSAFKTKRPLLHTIRAILGAIAFAAFTLGVRELSLANALAICFAAPFFMVLFSTLLIGEPIGIHRIGAMIAGFIGVLVVLQPDQGVFEPAAIYLLTTAATYALSQVLARKYAETESSLSYSFWTTAGMAGFGLILMPFFWQAMSFEDILWCVGMGLSGGVAHYLMVEAVRIAPPAAVSPMEYTALIWAAIFDWMIWQLIPEHATLLGSSVIIASGIYILWRERLHNIEDPVHEHP
jgi:drug/metabolite transporter (DMT)-like permease